MPAWPSNGSPSIRSRSRKCCVPSRNASATARRSIFLGDLERSQLLTADQVARLRADVSDADTDEARITKLEVNGTDDEPKAIGPYRILRKLGQGGMGAVYLAFDGEGNRQVAIKVLAADQANKQNILQRFEREGRHGVSLSHANIIRTFAADVDPASGLHYIVLEYVAGCTAHDLLDRFGKLTVGDAVHIVLDVARALEYAHKNQIIHRDIKPANILVNTAGLAKLSDLGLAKRRDDSANLTNADQGIGTPYYVAHEQAMNAKKADERSDIYALGATLYHLVTGEVPFNGSSSLEVVEKKGVGVFRPASSINPAVPDRLDVILAQMMARYPSDRYQTASDLIVDLERSQLASAIPSFIEVDAALQDPVVRQRLTSPIEPTQPDLQLQKAMADQESKEKVTWFVRYTDQRGNLCKGKGSTKEVRDRLETRHDPARCRGIAVAERPVSSRGDLGRVRRHHGPGRQAVAETRRADRSGRHPLLVGGRQRRLRPDRDHRTRDRLHLDLARLKRSVKRNGTSISGSPGLRYSETRDSHPGTQIPKRVLGTSNWQKPWKKRPFWSRYPKLRGEGGVAGGKIIPLPTLHFEIAHAMEKGPRKALPILTWRIASWIQA